MGKNEKIRGLTFFLVVFTILMFIGAAPRAYSIFLEEADKTNLAWKGAFSIPAYLLHHLEILIPIFIIMAVLPHLLAKNIKKK